VFGLSFFRIFTHHWEGEVFRYKITIEYDGAFFCGWQRQQSDMHADFVDKFSNGCTVRPSVQGTIERAIFNLTGRCVLVEGAGRTDAGVHALAQVAHFDSPLCLDVGKLIAGLNFFARGCSILNVQSVPPDFHARFSAVSREYVYKIVNRRSPLAIDRGRAWHVSRPIDVEVVKQSAEEMLGSHNFNAFRSSACQSKNPVKTLDVFDVFERNEHIECRVKARSFLHNQVRIMVGTLVWIGTGKLQNIVALLEHGDRTKSGPTAPAHGLYLAAVNYREGMV
jgi:tRNA pseudouridine38-40 synthase